MRKYLFCEAGFVEKTNWQPNCWINVECPDESDFRFLQDELKVPRSFLNDIADTDERPRTDTEGNWLLTILRIPMQTPDSKVPYVTVPIGIITNNELVISVCYYSTEMLPDFIEHTQRKGINVPNKYELILRLIYSSAVWFLKYLKQINNEVNCAEKELERSIRNEDLLRLMNLQKSLDGYDGCLRVHYLQQREHHHETHDQSLHHPDGAYADCQFLRYERGYSHRRLAPCVCPDCLLLDSLVGSRIRHFPENQMVLS